MISAKPKFHLFLFICLACCFAGCYEPIEGCLDVRATNFDLNADRSCPDNCCEYPELRLKLLHRYQQIDTYGLDLAFHDLEQGVPEGLGYGLTANPEAGDVARDPDENLPWPNPQLLAQWWSANRGNFQTGRRYLCGREINAESLVQTLRDGMQRQRAAAALELGLLKPNRPLFEVRARGDWQRKWPKC